MPAKSRPSSRARGLVFEVVTVAVVAMFITAVGCANGGGDVPDAGSCDPSLMTCGSRCVDVMSDPGNCGACNKTCGGSQVCVAGQCQGLPCPAGEKACPNDAGAQICVHTSTDNANCGKCGQVCAKGQFCNGGTCSNGCIQGQMRCSTDAGVTYCANLQTDQANCGMCGNKCASDLLCTSGSCASTCSPDQTECNADAGIPYCANLQTDNANCGNCGMACGTLQMCVGGTCTSACDGSQTACIPDAGQPYCADTQTDAANCGTCGNVCPPSLPVCEEGMCSSSSGCLLGGHNPPSQCTAGTDPQTGSPWVVCSADCNTAWLSCANANGGNYHAKEICNSLGYSNFTMQGGNCGDACGYCQSSSCSMHGNMTFDSGGSCGMDANGPILCITVTWLCVR